MIQASAIRRLAHNTVWSLVAGLLARAANVVIFIVVSRLAGPGEAGILTIGFSYLAIAGRFAAWGLDQILIRDVAKDVSLSGRYFLNFGLLRLVLSSVTTLILGAFVSFGPYSDKSTFAIWLLIFNVWPEGILNLSQTIFIAHERMSYVALFGAIVGSTKLAFGLLALFGGFGLTGVLWGILLANILAALVSVLIAHRILDLRLHSLDLSFWGEQLKIAAPFVLIAGSYILDNQADTVALSLQVSKDMLGWYGAASALIVGISLLPQAYRDAVFPTLSRAFSSEFKTLDYLYRRSMKYMLIAALPITFGLMMLAEPVLVLIYGERFAAATPALQILAIAAGMQFVMILQNRLLVIANQQLSLSIYISLGFIINIIGNYLFVPAMGMAGAAIARVSSNILVYALSYGLIRRVVYPFHIGTIWVRPLLAVIVMLVTIGYASDLTVILRIVLGAVTYIIMLLLLGTFTREEISLKKGILVSKKN